MIPMRGASVPPYKIGWDVALLGGKGLAGWG